MKKGCVYFHQGWTDIIICLGLIGYYNDLYDKLTILIRSDASDLINFYIKTMPSVNLIYLNTDNGRYYGEIHLTSNNINVEYNGSVVSVPNDYDILFHGEHDKWRKDNLNSYWWRPTHNKKNANHFSEMFYTYYNIDFNNRVDKFTLNRDTNLENEIYDKFIKIHGNDYIIFHDDTTNHLHGSLHVSTKIDFSVKNEKIAYVNLNKISTIFFDYIKVIENATEIHLVDSIWAAICYQLDAKYGIFNEKIINLYCKRGHQNMFIYPVKLKNWKII